ncbi:hypothetical protein EJ02DRAFT_454671 [Clathrospora elynae]|uniref:CYTH domain-containing protein n=1 Tax=Clathrospora elynae TaxID=706981 RepID=A0A6A5STX3_9PLEO|nr:hypothetical protein EJ02DRAFT_454671 [Clathrospora elynae]
MAMRFRQLPRNSRNNSDTLHLGVHAASRLFSFRVSCGYPFTHKPHLAPRLTTNRAGDSRPLSSSTTSSQPHSASTSPSKMTVLELALQRLKSHIFQRLSPGARSSARTLEVERKFTPTKESINRLRKNNGAPAFQSHKYLGRKVIKEFYLDSDCGSLMDNGIYVRVRNGVFEAKVRKGGDCINSVFLETQGRQSVKKLVANVVPHGEIRLEDLQPSRWMRTLREEWEVDGFNVVVDSTLFGAWLWSRPTYPQKPHVVGEVELCRDVKGGEGEDEGGEMDQKIEAFMKKHEWAFPISDGNVEGKLTAYGKWEVKLFERMCAEDEEEDTRVLDESEKKYSWSEIARRHYGDRGIW